MKIFKFFLLVAISFTACKKIENKKEAPKLVVGIVVDQMRYDYLTRFKNRFGEGGFKRLLRDGFSLENAHFNYIPTYTAPGHASIFTGTSPENHGIISNSWYDKFDKKWVYCVDDERYNTIGNDGKEGKKSPYRMFTSTITDQLQLAQKFRGKTIGIGIKDRSAILPAGHTANAAYWFDGGNNGQWITSSFYVDALPKWVTDFNSSNIADNLLNESWSTLYDINTYSQSRSDNNEFEGTYKGEETPTFPHDLPNLRKQNGNYSLIKGTPAGNTITKEFAKAAIAGENLGKSSDTDFLTLSFSSTDYVGHQFGPASVEIEDTYLRLDKDLEDLFLYLDTEVGKGKYTIFLTADHAAVHNPNYLQSKRIPAHYFSNSKFASYIKEKAKKHFGSSELIENISNYQIFLDYEKLDELNLTVEDVADKLSFEAVKYEGIYKAISGKDLQTKGSTEGLLDKLQKGYNQKLSGDVLLVPYPATLTGNKTGTSHGSGYSYDTHVPILFYGNGIKSGMSKKKYSITDITPTIANLLEIEAPNGTSGIVIDEALK